MAEKNIGGLWLKTGKAGKKFMTGRIEIDGIKHKFVVFKNTYKNADNQPDYQIFPGREDYKKREGEGSPEKAYADVDEGSIPF